MFRRPAAIAASILLASATSRAGDWKTRDRALLCPSPFVVREGLLASRDHNEKWFRETGCIAAGANWPVVIMDATGDVWKGRVKSPAGEASMWFPPSSVFDANPKNADPASFDKLLKNL